MNKSAVGSKRMHLPRVIRREVIEALTALERSALVNDCEKDAMALLAEYRASRSNGILNPLYIRSMSPFLIAAIERLERAYGALHSFNPDDYISAATASRFGEQGGRPDAYDKELMKNWIREVIHAHSGPKRQKGTDIIEAVQARCDTGKKPRPEGTYIRVLLKEVRGEAPEKVR